MIVHRITNSQYKDDISGTGAKIFGARWNLPGSPMLYTAESLSLAVLELLVHIGLQDIQHFYHSLAIMIPDDAGITEISAAKLKKNWHEDEEYSAFMGTEFLRNNKNLVMKVPSAIIPDEFNYVVNPNHADFRKIRIKRSKPFIFDQRLYTFK